jgi:transcriptional regulator with XRE-family HTH domain
MLIGKTLAQYIKDIRTDRSIKCSDFAGMIGISTAYLSQLEKGTRCHPDPHLMLRIAKILNVTSEEASTLFDLYAQETGQLPPDITEYLTGNQAALQALRQARDANVTAEDWERFIGQLKK